MTEEVWRERDTTPSKIEAALRHLLIERYHDEDAFVPARVLNLVVVVDGEFRGEIENRLERVGRYHPSRLVPDLATVLWAPHGHAEAVDSLHRLAQVVLVDSQDEPDVPAAFARSVE